MKHICMLLPHELNIVIQDFENKIKYLGLIESILSDAVEAIEHFLNGNLKDCFDAQVGETLCQIRAYKNLLFYNESILNNKTNVEGYYQNLINLVDKVSKRKTLYYNYLTVKKNERPENLSKAQTLLELLNFEGLEYINYDIFYLIISYILAKYNIKDESNIPVAINIENLGLNYCISKHYAKKIVRHLQGILSKLSTNFILDLAEELSLPNNMTSFIASLIADSDEGRVVMPCYSVSDLIIRHICYKKTHIALNVYLVKAKCYVTFFCRPNGQGDFEFVERHQLQETMPVLVFDGISTYDNHTYDNNNFINYFKAMFDLGILNIIMGNQAKHPQYSGKRLSEYRFKPFKHYDESNINESSYLREIHHDLLAQFTKYKIFAETMGCCQENSFLFFIKHIYFSTSREMTHIHALTTTDEITINGHSKDTNIAA